ncbi:nitrate- and nitrite sensing domain-containing protein [Streptomyces sp. NEAU-W12]|uniref:nitrate- and nitrite sensing domain-containing protein n=1 Tax=Streptomyces sp. NEAU-W12 TaxID=2994668 RepID=UPI00224ADE0E|nr:nitrate- and nitrite sensing domain-containing protein [Streptomyces sp. NEAU-W12]MCX2926082.1 nitrate- and nitrite sensing domain-containing protein [Streptomyces sp. NEAU-W12]
MRFRGKSIRRKIVALLLVPLVSLTTIWAFTTVLTGREASHLFEVSSVMEEVGYPVEDTVRVLQQERRQTLVHLADPRASDGLTALRRSRIATDKAVNSVRENAAKPDVRDAMGQDTEALDAVLDSLEGIESLRRSVEDGTVDRSQALDLYNGLVDPCYILLADLHVVDDVGLDKQYRALVSLARARELLAREDALLGSALIVGTLSPSEVRDISDLMAQRTLLYGVGLPQLPASERDRYESFWKNAASAPLRVAEEAAVSSGTGPPRGITAKSWDTAAGHVLEELATLNDQASDRYQDRVRPVAVGVITQAVVAGLLGLVALLVSLVLSVRVGRGLIRDLRQLRLEAHEASGVRLPGVMRRLSAGEQVDVETEVPRLEYDRNEIGEVGQALNTLQRAAVEAAVKQSELRSGVSEVFVNLARRSQVLLHKQLTLLDTMERRTDDTEELADLFRLDHLTTRMRRHAEGLVILSGAAPSRQWRKPVQLMDVVRAAVAEVEDYERIEVRRLPRVAVTGPAVADLTHLVAELLENATVFSPPHTAVQVLGERVANGFTLEIHDRGLGMAAEALLDANLRLAETPEFELSDTDRLGLFVVSRLAQRQKVRVSLQPSPYGGTTAVVFIPDALLTDDVPDTNGVGFRLDRPRRAKDRQPEDSRRLALSQVPARLPGLPAALLDGPVELEAPVGLDALDDHPGAPADEGRGGLFGHRRSPSRTKEERPGRRREPQQQAPGKGNGVGADLDTEGRPEAPLRRGTPKLVSSHGRPVGDEHARRERTDQDTGAPSARPEREPAPVLPARRRGEQPSPERDPEPSEGEKPPPLPARRRGAASRPRIGAHAADRPADRAPRGPARDDGPVAPAAGDVPDGPAHPAVAADPRQEHSAAGPGPGSAPRDTGTGGPADPASLPRRVRQASLSPQLKRSAPRRNEERSQPVERDAEEVRSRMASLQRGWQRGREENATGDNTSGGAAPRETTRTDQNRPGTTKGDGR